MAPRTGYPRPTSDGTDGKYRMVIEDRYKQSASYRKGMRSFFYAIIMIGLFYTGWRTVPMFIEGAELDPLTALHVGLLTTFTLLHIIGTGWNTPTKENLLFLRIHIVVGVVTLAALAYDVYINHFQLPQADRIPRKLAKFTSAAAGSEKLGTVETFGIVLHGTLDVCLGLSLTAACILTGAYIRLKGSASSAKKSN